MKIGISVVWKMGKLEIERTVRPVCQEVLSEAGRADAKKFVAALEQLGVRYSRAGRQASSGKGSGPDLSAFMGGETPPAAAAAATSAEPPPSKEKSRAAPTKAAAAAAARKQREASSKASAAATSSEWNLD